MHFPEGILPGTVVPRKDRSGNIEFPENVVPGKDRSGNIEFPENVFPGKDRSGKKIPGRNASGNGS